MRNLLLSLLFLTIILSAVTAITTAKAIATTLPIEGELDIPNGESASNIRVTLNGGEHSALSRIDGRFSFHDIPSGIYLLDVLSINQVFSTMKLKVLAEEGVVEVVEYKYPGAMRMQASYPLRLRAIAPLSYFQPRPPFNIFSFIMGNPMMLIMLVMVVVVVFFPDVLKGITDNEEFKKGISSQKDMQTADPMASWKRVMGLETKVDDDDE